MSNQIEKHIAADQPWLSSMKKADLKKLSDARSTVNKSSDIEALFGVSFLKDEPTDRGVDGAVLVLDTF